MHIVLFEPEIPQNTGNISRTCSVTGSSLHLIEPLGFTLDEKHLKRAGLDYWDALDLHIYKNWETFLSANPNANLYYASTKGKRRYDKMAYQKDDYLVFGKESRGLSETLLKNNYDHTVRIPMLGESRSLNLSNSVAILLYEALRQQDFAGFKEEGALTGRKEEW